MRFLVALAAALVSAASLFTGVGTARLLPVDARPLGLTYEQWDVAWNTAQAKRSLAAETSLVATDGTRCGLQRGGARLLPVSLLGGTTFRCTIPRRTLLVFPVAGYVSWGSPPRRLHARVLAGFDRIRDLELVIDGRALKPGHVLTTPVYVVGLPLRNSLGAPTGPISMMSKDAFAILSPLAAGPHTMHVRITFDGAARSYAASYRLLVR